MNKAVISQLFRARYLCMSKSKTIPICQLNIYFDLKIYDVSSN